MIETDGKWPLDPLNEDTEHGVDMRGPEWHLDSDGYISKKNAPKRQFDWANMVVLPVIGACLLYIAWRYWGLPWDVIKEILFHD